MTRTQEVAKPADQAAILEQVIIHGNLAELTAEQRLVYYRQVCESVGLNPMTRPFQYITLSGKLTLYATKDCTEQLRKRDNISVILAARDLHENVGAYVVTARASTPAGRTDEATGAVSIVGLKGEALANALMKAETKAKRRVTLSICGLGVLDESEVDTIPDVETGEIRSVRPGWQSPPVEAGAIAAGSADPRTGGGQTAQSVENPTPMASNSPAPIPREAGPTQTDVPPNPVRPPAAPTTRHREPKWDENGKEYWP